MCDGDLMDGKIPLQCLLDSFELTLVEGRMDDFKETEKPFINNPLVVHVS